MKLTNNEKSQIRENLRQYVAKFPSQNKAAQSLTGISSATLSTLLQGKWENISDDMWRNLASQLGTGTGGDWQTDNATVAKNSATRDKIRKEQVKVVKTDSKSVQLSLTSFVRILAGTLFLGVILYIPYKARRLWKWW